MKQATAVRYWGIRDRSDSERILEVDSGFDRMVPADPCVQRVVRGDLKGSGPVPLRLDLANHSPTGFEWGYGGSGPSQLALAILADFLEDDPRALRIYRAFTQRVITHIRSDSWTMLGDFILSEVERIESSV